MMVSQIKREEVDITFNQDDSEKFWRLQSQVDQFSMNEK